MKFTHSITCLLITISVYAQDSTNQKNSLFKLSGISMLGGASFLNFPQNKQVISKQNLATIWPDFVNKSYYNYSQNIQSYNTSDNGGMFGVYASFDNYNKKKKEYSIHSQTNVGITLFTQRSLHTGFSNIKASRKDTAFAYNSPNSYTYYDDNVTINRVNINYQSLNVGLDVQQLFTTNQNKIISAFVGVGATANLSILSQINFAQTHETGVNRTLDPNTNYQIYNHYLLSNDKDSLYGTGLAKVKSSVLYQIYIPFGVNLRCGYDDRKIISHFYVVTQIRLGYEVLKIQSTNAFIFKTSYLAVGLKYRI